MGRDVMTMATALIYSRVSYPVKTKIRNVYIWTGIISTKKKKHSNEYATNKRHRREKRSKWKEKKQHKAILIKIYPLIFDVILMLLCVLFSCFVRSLCVSHCINLNTQAFSSVPEENDSQRMWISYQTTINVSKLHFEAKQTPKWRFLSLSL